MGDPVYGLSSGALFVVGLAAFAGSPTNPALFATGLVALAIAAIFGYVALWL